MPDESEDPSRDSDGERESDPAVTSDDAGDPQGPADDPGDPEPSTDGGDAVDPGDPETTTDGGDAVDSAPDDEVSDADGTEGSEDADVGGDGAGGLQKVERESEPGPAEPPDDDDAVDAEAPDTGDAPDTSDTPDPGDEAPDAAGAEAPDTDDADVPDADDVEAPDATGADVPGTDDGSGNGGGDPGSRGDGTVPESNVAFAEDELADPVADPDVDVADLEDGAPVGPRPAEPEDPEEGPPVGPRPAEPDEDGPRPEPEEGPRPDDGPPGPGPDDASTVSPEDPDEPEEATFGPPPDGPPDDEEMPLADHIEEMVSRLGVVAVAVAAATALAFPLAEDVLVVMWYDTLPAAASDPHVYGPLEKILAEIKVASLAGILVALPVLVYQSYLFMRPGLYPRERRYYLAAVPTSLVLGAIGMAFAYFLVLPALFQYFVYYSESGVDQLAFGLRVTFDLIVAMLGAFAVVFQIPLLIMLAIMMGVTSRQWLEARRIYFWGGFVGVGFLMGGADLTGMAPIIIGATMIGLFEGTLLLLRWTDN